MGSFASFDGQIDSREGAKMRRFGAHKATKPQRIFSSGEAPQISALAGQSKACGAVSTLRGFVASCDQPSLLLSAFAPSREPNSATSVRSTAA